VKLIIYIPALNEAKDIKNVIKSLPRLIDGIDEINYLVVDDGSTDDTAEIALSVGASVVSHGRNLGVGAAFQSSVEFALANKADVLVGIDADGQFDANEIPILINPILNDQVEMVIGNRFTSGIPRYMPVVKYWGNKVMCQLIYSVGGQKYQDVSCGFRAYSREALLRLNGFANFTYTHETILSLLFQKSRISEVPIMVKYFPERKSRVANSIFRYALQTTKIIFRVLLDYRPMRIFGVFGGVLILIGIVFIFLLLGYYVVMHAFTPYKSFGFIGLGFIVFGMFVLVIALIADMLNRLRLIQDKLLYEIKKNRYGSNF
jgi:glycosyltransferase involved in cell wall biosynthesis